MRKHLYLLKANDMWLGEPIELLFFTQKEADKYFQCFCIGCGMICKATLENARNIDGKKFYNKNSNSFNALLLKQATNVKIYEGNWR